MAVRWVVSAVALGLLLGGIGRAEDVYKWTDDQGHVHYSDRGGPADAEKRQEESTTHEQGWESVLERKRGAQEIGERAETAINTLQMQLIRKKRERTSLLSDLDSTREGIVQAQSTDPSQLPTLRAREVAQATAAQRIDIEISGLEMQIGRLRAVKASSAEPHEKAPFGQ